MLLGMSQRVVSFQLCKVQELLDLALQLSVNGAVQATGGAVTAFGAGIFAKLNFNTTVH